MRRVGDDHESDDGGKEGNRSQIATELLCRFEIAICAIKAGITARLVKWKKSALDGLLLRFRHAYDATFAFLQPCCTPFGSTVMAVVASLVPVERVERRILLLRRQRVILDADLANLYGVSTKRLNEQVK